MGDVLLWTLLETETGGTSWRSSRTPEAWATEFLSMVRYPTWSASSTYLASDLFCLLSEQEGFGLVVLEGWQHGLRVLVADRPALNEVVESGRNGLAGEPRVSDVSTALAWFHDNPDERLSMARMGLPRWAVNFLDRSSRKPFGVKC